VLDGPEDYFVRLDRAGPDGKPLVRFVSARTEANRLLGSLPAPGQAEYQKLHGDDAAQRLAQAKQLSDPHLLADVAAPYQHTRAGAEAVDLLATYHLSRDEPLIAALWFGRLLARPAAEPPPQTLYKAALAFHRSGDKEKGEGVWKQLAERLKKDGG